MTQRSTIFFFFFPCPYRVLSYKMRTLKPGLANTVPGTWCVLLVLFGLWGWVGADGL